MYITSALGLAFLCYLGARASGNVFYIVHRHGKKVGRSPTTIAKASTTIAKASNIAIDKKLLLLSLKLHNLNHGDATDCSCKSTGS